MSFFYRLINKHVTCHLSQVSSVTSTSVLSSGSPTEFCFFCPVMRTSDKFPWELLKAECLRLVCAQLVEASSESQNSFKPGRKNDMVAFLRDVHERGVLEALKDLEPSNKVSVSAPIHSKRKSPPVDGEDEDAEGVSDNEDTEGYNTRYKGVKRVKVDGFSPEPTEAKPRRRASRPRKSAPDGSAVEARKRGRPRKDASTLGEQIKVSKRKEKPVENGEVIPSISRPRGRPRKVVAQSTNGVGESARKPRQSTNTNAPKSKDSSREVFDGILLVKRSQNEKERSVEDDHGGDHGGEAPNDEGDGSKEDAVLAVANGDAHGDLSSLGGSNKENEHEASATYTPDPEDSGHDIDADGEFEADAEV